MTEDLQFSAADLARWGMLEAARREAAIDALIACVPMPSDAEAQVLLRQWAQQQGISSAAMLQPRLMQLGLAQDDLPAVVARSWRWQQWCEQHCGARLSSHFLARKAGLDQVSFWRLLTPDADLAAELHQRLKEGETSFEGLAQQGAAADQSWQVSFSPLRSLEQVPPDLAALLRVSEPGTIWSPRPASEGGWQVLQVQQLRPAVLDATVRQRLLLELGENALQAVVRGAAADVGQP